MRCSRTTFVCSSSTIRMLLLAKVRFETTAGLLKIPAHGVGEARYVEGLRQVIVRARRAKAFDLTGRGIGAGDDHRDVARCLVGPQTLQDLVAMHIRQMQVE